MTTATVNNSFAELLKEETEKALKRADLTWKVGLGIAIILGGYLTYMSVRYTNVVLNPDNLAAIAIDKVNGKIPEIIDGAEKYLIAEAPNVTHQAHQEISNLVPIVGKSARVQIDRLYQEVPMMFERASPAFDNFFNQHSDEIRALFTLRDKAGSDERFVEAFVDVFMTGVAEMMERDIQIQHNGKTVKGPLKMSVYYLGQINRHLAKLASKSPSSLNRKERMQRRLIVAWSKALGKHLGVKIGRGV